MNPERTLKEPSFCVYYQCEWGLNLHLDFLLIRKRFVGRVIKYLKDPERYNRGTFKGSEFLQQCRRTSYICGTIRYLFIYLQVYEWINKTFVNIMKQKQFVSSAFTNHQHLELFLIRKHCCRVLQRTSNIKGRLLRVQDFLKSVIGTWIFLYKLKQKKERKSSKTKRNKKDVETSWEERPLLFFFEKPGSCEETRRGEERVLLCTDASSFRQPQNNTVTSAAQKCPTAFSDGEQEPALLSSFPFFSTTKPLTLSMISENSPQHRYSFRKFRKLFCEMLVT